MSLDFIVDVYARVRVESHIPLCVCVYLYMQSTNVAEEHGTLSLELPENPAEVFDALEDKEDHLLRPSNLGWALGIGGLLSR